MRRILLASVAISTLTLGAVAQEAPMPPPNAPAAGSANETTNNNPNVDAGVAVGGTAGAITGAVVGGPVGAVIGGFAGAMLGSAAAVPAPVVDYVVAHPIEPVTIGGGLSAGVRVPEAVVLAPIPDHPDYAYVYSDGRPVIVTMRDREVVYSPGYVVPEETVTYVRSNPRDPVAIHGGMAVGAVVPPGVELIDVPSDPAYAYVYTDRGPILVNRGSRAVVWVGGG